MYSLSLFRCGSVGESVGERLVSFVSLPASEPKKYLEGGEGGEGGGGGEGAAVGLAIVGRGGLE
jgi:hypothetical protein